MKHAYDPKQQFSENTSMNIIEEASCRRHHWGGIMGEESLRYHGGGTAEDASIIEASLMRHHIKFENRIEIELTSAWDRSETEVTSK